MSRAWARHLWRANQPVLAGLCAPVRSSLLCIFVCSLLGHQCLAQAPSKATLENPHVAAVGEDPHELVEKLQESRNGVVEAESQKRRILGSLYVINQKMKKISNNKGHLTNELFQVQDNVKTIAKIIAGLELQIEKQRAQLKIRLRALYKLSGQGYIGIVFSRTNASDFDETLRFLKIVTDNDYHLIRNYQENVAVYKSQKNKLRGQIERLVAIEKSIKKQETLLASEHLAKSKIVSELDREKIANLARIQVLRVKGENLPVDAMNNMNLADLLKPSIYEQRGQLSAPVQGMVVQDFGLVTDERYKIHLSHKGWRMACAAGAPVAAIFDGKVIFAESIAGYGTTVIIDHGDHYYSVYAQIARSKVKTGDTLKRGETFAEAGPATQEFAQGLYFEIRHFSEPENPANWILSKEIHQASVASAAEN